MASSSNDNNNDNNNNNSNNARNPLLLDGSVPNTVILAKIGQGKTSLLKAIVEYNTSKPFVVLDTLGVMPELKAFNNVFYICPLEHPETSRDGIVNYAIRTLRVLRERLNVPVFLVVDEIDHYNYGDKNSLQWLINYGRNYGLFWIFTYRRTANASKDYVFNCPNFFIGRHKLDIDLKRITKLADVTEEQISTLPDYHFLVIKNDTPAGIVSLQFLPVKKISGSDRNP